MATFSSNDKLEIHRKSCNCDNGNSSDSDNTSSSSSDSEFGKCESGDECAGKRLDTLTEKRRKKAKPDKSVRQTCSKVIERKPILRAWKVPGKLNQKIKPTTQLIKAAKLRARNSKACFPCKKYFDCYEDLVAHRRSIHKFGWVISRHLVVSWPEEGLTIDDLINPEKTKFTCHLCKMGFARAENLESHQKLHGDFKCSICNVSKAYAVDMAIHQFTHRSEEDANISCEDCAKAVTKTTFIPHYIKEHLVLEPDKFLCPICDIPVVHLNGGSTLISQVVNTIGKHYLKFHKGEQQQYFQCKKPNCKAYFLKRSQLNLHINDVHGNKFKCSECGKRFKEEWCLRYHRKQHTKELKCPNCDRSFVYNAQTQLSAHMKTCVPRVKTEGMKTLVSLRDLVVSHPDQGLTIDDYVNPDKTKYACRAESCMMGFTTETDFESHQKLHGKFKCNFCDHTESFAAHIALHELSHATKKDRRVKCPRGCKNNGTFYKTEYFQHYVEDHLGLRMDTFQCPICGHSVIKLRERKYIGIGCNPVKFIASHYIAQHDLTRVQGPVFKCEKENCTAYFITKLQLAQHVEKIHRAGDVSKCEDCGKVFQTRAFLRAHRIGYHKLKEEDFQFVCEKHGCAARFEREIDLEAHSATHTWSTKTDQQFHCTETGCGKVFANRGNLTAHKRVHRKASHVCQYCGRAYVTESKLKDHLVFDEDPGNWKFSCKICKKAFIKNDALRSHMKSHSTVKSYVCQECGQGYVHRHNLRHHLKSKHGIVEPFQKSNRPYKESAMKGKKFKREKSVKIS